MRSWLPYAVSNMTNSHCFSWVIMRKVDNLAGEFLQSSFESHSPQQYLNLIQGRKAKENDCHPVFELRCRNNYSKKTRCEPCNPSPWSQIDRVAKSFILPQNAHWPKRPPPHRRKLLQIGGYIFWAFQPLQNDLWIRICLLVPKIIGNSLNGANK